MTQTMGVDASNDIYTGPNGNVVILQAQAAVQAACNSTSKARLLEEVLAQTSGLPFFQSVFNGVPKLAVFENALQNALMAVDGVIAVTNITSSVQKVNGKTTLVYGATIENQFGLQFTLSGSL